MTYCPTCMYYRSIPIHLELQLIMLPSTVRSGDCDNNHPAPLEFSNTEYVLSLAMTEVINS